MNGIAALTVILAAFIEIGVATLSDNCKECDFYRCFEDKMNCGIQGYFIGYGKKYCDRFSANLHLFTPAGINWITCVRRCLIDSLIPHYEQFPHGEFRTSCAALAQTAFDAHVDCYVNCGFCKMCPDNKWALWKSYDIGDFLSLVAWEQIRDVSQRCGGWTTCFF